MKRMNMIGLAVVLGASLAACGGGDDGNNPDGGVVHKCEVEGGAACFVPPTAVMSVNGGMPANWNCVPPAITPSTAPITVSGIINDFQTSSKTYEGATEDSFIDLNFDGAPTATTTSIAGGAYTMTIPTGGALTYMNFRGRHPMTLDTIATRVHIDTTMATVSADRQLISKSTAMSIPALLGVVRTDGTGVLAGSVADCDDNDVQNAIVTVSSTSGMNHTDVPGMQMYYFTSGLPVRRTAQAQTNTDGLFVAIQVPAAASHYYVQAWGYKTAADLASGTLSFISEVEIPALANTVVTTNMPANGGI